jgi:hypothetical protein
MRNINVLTTYLKLYTLGMAGIATFNVPKELGEPRKLYQHVP